METPVRRLSTSTLWATHEVSGAWWTANTLRRYPEQCGEMTYQTREIEGIHRETAFTRITEGLRKRGFAEEQISMVLGGNWLRVFTAAWSPSQTAVSDHPAVPAAGAESHT